MKRVVRGARLAWPAAAALAAGCAHHGDTGTSAYIFGTIFVLLGIALGVALILGSR